MNAFDALHFIRPAWLLMLPLAVLLPWLWKRSRRPAGDWGRVCDPHLLQWLSVKQVDQAGHGAGPWLAGLALLIATLALAGPAWQKLPDASYAARDARVVALDLSRSMLAEDLRPNRLTRARFRLADLLEETEEGQVGLVSYAGDAYVVAPLTSDMNTIANLLPALQPDIMPVAGSRADRAMDMAASLLERSGFQHGELLLVTDSATSRDAARARELRDRGIVTSVLAVGTPKGAPIPSGGGFVSDRAGNVVIAHMDRDALRAVAEAGGGRYSELGATDAMPWREHDGSEFEKRDDALGERWKDAGPWLVLLLLPLALLGFRRGLFFVLPLLALNGILAPVTAQAGLWEDLWQRKDQQAYEALQHDDAQAAAALAQDPSLSGEAWYRSKEYASAQDAWSGAPTADGHYNRGNALALMGEYDAAIRAYDAALAEQPGMQDALHNREVVEKLMEKQQQEQQQQQQQQEGDQDQSSGSQSDSEQQEGDASEQSQDQQGQEGDQADQQDAQQQQDQQGEEGQQDAQQQDYSESWSEEDAQAMEQWLRRIPDDPGGLLRRKFRSQHQRRGAPGDETESW
jgi:Ca-activated chloride channel family protein